MHLPWRDMPAGGRLINTSLTGPEAETLARLADGRDVLEVGSAFGYSAAVMVLGGAKHVTAVDPHDRLNSHGVMLANLKGAGVAGQVTVVRGESPAALDRLSGPYGLVFIDGDHTASGVLADVGAARKLLAGGGVLAVHDLGEDCCCPGVRLALESLFPEGPSEHVDTLAVYRGLA